MTLCLSPIAFAGDRHDPDPQECGELDASTTVLAPFAPVPIAHTGLQAAYLPIYRSLQQQDLSPKSIVLLGHEFAGEGRAWQLIEPAARALQALGIHVEIIKTDSDPRIRYRNAITYLEGNRNAWIIPWGGDGTFTDAAKHSRGHPTAAPYETGTAGDFALATGKAFIADARYPRFDFRGRMLPYTLWNMETVPEGGMSFTSSFGHAAAAGDATMLWDTYETLKKKFPHTVGAECRKSRNGGMKWYLPAFINTVQRAADRAKGTVYPASGPSSSVPHDKNYPDTKQGVRDFLRDLRREGPRLSLPVHTNALIQGTLLSHATTNGNAITLAFPGNKMETLAFDTGVPLSRAAVITQCARFPYARLLGEALSLDSDAPHTFSNTATLAHYLNEKLANQSRTLNLDFGKKGPLLFVRIPILGGGFVTGTSTDPKAVLFDSDPTAIVKKNLPGAVLNGIVIPTITGKPLIHNLGLPVEFALHDGITTCEFSFERPVPLLIDGDSQTVKNINPDAPEAEGKQLATASRLRFTRGETIQMFARAGSHLARVAGDPHTALQYRLADTLHSNWNGKGLIPDIVASLGVIGATAYAIREDWSEDFLHQTNDSMTGLLMHGVACATVLSLGPGGLLRFGAGLLNNAPLFFLTNVAAQACAPVIDTLLHRVGDSPDHVQHLRDCFIKIAPILFMLGLQISPAHQFLQVSTWVKGIGKVLPFLATGLKRGSEFLASHSLLLGARALVATPLISNTISISLIGYEGYHTYRNGAALAMVRNYKEEKGETAAHLVHGS